MGISNRRKLFIVLIGVLASSIFLGGCADSDAKGDKTEVKKDQLVLAVGGEPEEGFDPTTGWGRYGSPLFQSTLLTRDKDLSITYDLAKSYNISDDGLTWTVEIRNDVKFSDGKPLTAEDVVFTFQTAAASASVIDLSNLEQVKKEDNYTVKFILKKPQSTFSSLLVTTGIVPKHAYQDDYHENPVGSGPFQLVQWDKGQQLIVEENPYYYDDKPFFKKVTFLFLSEDAAFAAAKAGEIDVVSVPAAFANQEIAGMELLTLESVDNRGIMFPFVKEGGETELGAPLGNDVTADKDIRKAINIAVDRQALAEGVLESQGTPAYSVADQLPWWNSDTIVEDADMEGASTILDDAGWLLNEDGIRMKDGLKAEFTLLYPSGDQIRQSLSMAFAEMIKPLGIDVKTEGKSWNEIEQLQHSYPVMMGWGSHDPLEIYNLYSSNTRGQGYYNANFYSNKTVDNYMNQAINATSEEEANRYWKLAQWDGTTGFSSIGDAPWVWLVNLEHLYYVREGLDIGVQKIQPHGHGWPVTDFITKWRWEEGVEIED